MKTLLIATLAALIAAGGTAYAQTSNVFGNGGVTYTFDDVCHRTTILPPGITDHESINVVAQQVSCLVHRENRMKHCYAKATLSFLGDHVRKGHPEGDWSGVDKLKACGSL